MSKEVGHEDKLDSKGGALIQQIDLDETHPAGPSSISNSLLEASQFGGSLISVMRILWARRRFIRKLTVWGFVISTLAAFIIPNKYESTACLMPPDTQSSSGLSALAGLAGLSGGLGATGLVGDFAGLKSSSAVFVGVLQSRTVQDRLIQQFTLQKVYSARHIEDARKTLQARSAISEDRKSGIVTITVSDRDPKRATEMAQAYVVELDRLMAQLSTSAARREREFLEGRLRIIREELEQAERDFSQFSSKSAAINIQEQGKALVTAAAALQGQLIAEETELEALKQTYSDNNVRVRTVQASVEELRRKVKELGGSSEVEQGGASMGASDLPYPSIRRLPLLAVPYADLSRRLQIDEVVYELLTREYEMARVQEAKEIPTVKELDVPIVPQKKSFPPRALLIVLGTLIAWSVSTVCIMTAEAWQRLTPDDPRRQLAQEIVCSAGRWWTGSYLPSRWRFLTKDRSWVNGRRYKEQDTGDPTLDESQSLGNYATEVEEEIEQKVASTSSPPRR